MPRKEQLLGFEFTCIYQHEIVKVRVSVYHNWMKIFFSVDVDFLFRLVIQFLCWAEKTQKK